MAGSEEIPEEDWEPKDPPGPLHARAYTTPSASQTLSGQESTADGQLVFVAQHQTRGPIPSAREIAGYAEVYPDAPAILFGELQAEGRHRRDVENRIVDGENRRADRGQWMAISVYVLTLLVGALLVLFDHDTAGAAIVTASLVSGAAIFLQQNRAAASAAQDQAPQPPSEGDGS